MRDSPRLHPEPPHRHGDAITIGMLVQTLYLHGRPVLVSGLGKEAVAGVAAAGNVTML